MQKRKIRQEETEILKKPGRVSQGDLGEVRLK
jgi:hypothetical protein